MMPQIGRNKTKPDQGRGKVFKKILFVFLLAAALLAYAGYGVPAAAACSTLSTADCAPIYGPNFDPIVNFPAIGAALGTASMTSPSSANLNVSSPVTDPARMDDRNDKFEVLFEQ